MECRDGIQLIGRIWQPAGKGPWPVLLMRQPYGRAIASTVTYAHPSWYAAHGFLVVVQDVRGQGASQGTFQGFDQELSDGADTIRWVRQLDGSNGRVGCYGFSYQGLSQLLSDNPAAIPDCLVPAMAGLDEQGDWACEGGAHWWALGLGWGLQLAALRCQRLRDDAGWQAIRLSLDSGAFLYEGLELLKRHDPGGMACRWLQLPASHATGWTYHQPCSALLQRPMLLIGGWHDPHLRGILNLFERACAAGGSPLLRIGAYSHLDWKGGVDRLQLAFFKHHLQDQAPAKRLSVAVLVENKPHTNGKHSRHYWRAPKSDSSPMSWGLRSCGLATIDEEEGELLPGQFGGGQVALVHDPWRPVPGRGGHLGLNPGLCERGDLDRRADVICFNSSPLNSSLEIEGRPLLTISVRADQPSFDLCAALSVLDRQGRVIQLSTGVARTRQPAGEKSLLQVHLQPLLAELAPGERLRLSLAGSAWPLIAVNPGDGREPLGPAGPHHRVITLELELAAAQLQLQPLINGKLRAH
ncbi:MAG: CocE/NonD family hydrolase [Cyanobacteria bacterium]|nr:CocE/NonD family hydrolase [Cyanobacteriota bacterium]